MDKKAVQLINLEGCHKVAVGPNLLTVLPGLSKKFAGKKATIISDEKVAGLYGPLLVMALTKKKLNVTIITVPEGDKYKNLQEVDRILRLIYQTGLQRDDLIIGLGGGVICDLAGFVAAIYMRGMPLLLLPTTLSAQVSAAVGSRKTLNLPEGKNIAGTFYAPFMTYADTNTLQTLDKQEIACGMAEIIKYAIIGGGDLLKQMNALPELTDSQQFLELLPTVIGNSCAFKAAHAVNDFYERGKINNLDFGSTLGNALEQVLDFRTGEALAIGMMATARFGKQINICKDDMPAIIEPLLKKMSLPTSLPNKYKEHVNELAAVVLRDRKLVDGKINMIFPVAPAAPLVWPLSLEDVSKFVECVFVENK